jgi:hypothetical protein
MSRYAGWKDVAAAEQFLIERGFAVGQTTFSPPRQPVRVAPLREKQAPPCTRALAADIFPAIKRLATQHGWDNRYTYSAIGPDPGLHIILVREAVLIFYLLDEGEAPTPLQRGWIEALQKTGQVEAAIWSPADFETIKTRLTRPRMEVCV